MKGEERRQEILKRLSQAETPVSAAVLAAAYGVSRQIIVQDIALLRAQGAAIVSLSRGYRMEEPAACRRVYKVVHTDEDVERELNAIVDLGGIVEDVFVSHRIYGTIRAPMGIRSRMDVKRFVEGIAAGKSSLLKNVTSNYHYHTVRADSQELLDLIGHRLEEEGFLAPLQDYEPVECSGCG
ncbi:transcription repressor NadR [Evtepia sp.]|uniref:transcription repressor NadR n=1 Tax=Evtepia sp. TaxID=2773933 RepID=UPI003F176B93